MAPKKQKPILVIKNRAIGDTILMTGSIRLLHRHFPGRPIHVMTRAPAGELLIGTPYIERIVSAVEPPSTLERTAYWLRKMTALRARRYQMVINFHASFRSAFMGRMLRSELFVANHHELRGRNWFSQKHVDGRGVVKSIIERDLDLLRAIGIDANPMQASPEIYLSKSERRDATNLLPDLSGKRIFLGIGASRITKRWPATHFIELMVSLLEVLRPYGKIEFIVSTLSGDYAWTSKFFELAYQNPILKTALLRFHDLKLRQIAGVLSRCTHFIGNDSGLKHLAAALGIPTFTFFGPEGPLEWHPYSESAHRYAFLEKLSCRTESGKHWCSIIECPRYQNQCLNLVQPEMVLEGIQQWIRDTSES